MSATLYGVLSRGLLTGRAMGGARGRMPRFAGEAGARNAAALEALLPPEAIEGTRYLAEFMKHLDSER